jgi:hypothetical protein
VIGYDNKSLTSTRVDRRGQRKKERKNERKKKKKESGYAVTAL